MSTYQTSPAARELVRRELGDSKNFMTPTILRYGKLARNVAFELSRGDGFLRDGFMYGVSIVGETARGDTFKVLSTGAFGFSRSFDSRADAEAYTEGLRRGRMA